MRHVSALVLMLLMGSAAAQHATVEGYVRDAKSGTSITGVNVAVYRSGDYGTTVALTETDSRGYYSVAVQPGSYYDVYLRMGGSNPNQRTSEAVSAGAVYTLNFNIASESAYGGEVVEKYGFGVVVAVALLILFIILVDQLFLRRSRKPGVKDLKGERDRLQKMLELTKSKYHRRELDEESFREITREHQQKLIELESQIKELEGK